jgi:hypothetical protein
VILSVPGARYVIVGRINRQASGLFYLSTLQCVLLKTEYLLPTIVLFRRKCSKLCLKKENTFVSKK